MGEIEWAMWANEQAVISAFLNLIGGIIGVAASFRNWEFATVVIATSVLLLLMEWPRGKRKRGNTMERTGQQYLTPLVDKLGPVSKNYYVRFLIQIIFSIPCCFQLTTIIGGMSLMISAFVYLVAANKGEEWKPVGGTSSQSQGPKMVVSDPPARPPPRPPRRDATDQDPENNRY